MNGGILERLNGIEATISRMHRDMVIASKDIWTIKDLAAYLGRTEDHIRHLASRHIIPYYKQSNRLFFKKDEIEEWLLSKRTPSNDEIEAQGVTRAILTRKNRKVLKNAL